MQEIVFREKLLAEENSIRLKEIKQLKWEQERVLKNVVEADKILRDGANVGRERSMAIVEREDVMKQLNKNITLQSDCCNAVDEIKRSDAEDDKEIEKLKEEIERWEAFRDKGMLEMKEEMRMMGRAIKEEENIFNFIQEQTKEQKMKREIEAISKIEKEKDLTRKQAVKKTVEEMNKMDKQTLFDNEWLVKELSLERDRAKHLERTMEELQSDNIQLILPFKKKHEDSVDHLVEVQTLCNQYLGSKSGDVGKEGEGEEYGDDGEGRDGNNDGDEENDEDKIDENKSNNNDKNYNKLREGNEMSENRWPVTAGMLRKKMYIP